MLICFLLFVICYFDLHSQTASTGTSTYFDMSGFPQWSKDLRRAEIIAFGSFPFAYFFSNFFYDAYRWSNNGWDNRYAPWPFNSSAAVGQTQSEKVMTLWIAAGGAVLIALVDYGIMRYKRTLLERESRNIPEGTPVIIRRPLSGEKEDTQDNGAEFTGTVPAFGLGAAEMESRGSQ
ncbi:MAG: hypothetical protein LBH42_00710 [Treponema sp.]|jgi:hypothetical protein|nr:hypothetical protein [Treponema sp.]